jgi:hypothetical protein
MERTYLLFSVHVRVEYQAHFYRRDYQLEVTGNYVCNISLNAEREKESNLNSKAHPEYKN